MCEVKLIFVTGAGWAIKLQADVGVDKCESFVCVRVGEFMFSAGQLDSSRLFKEGLRNNVVNYYWD